MRSLFEEGPTQYALEVWTADRAGSVPQQPAGNDVRLDHRGHVGHVREIGVTKM